MNLEEIKDLIRLVSKTGIRKVDIEREGFKITISGGISHSTEQPIYVQAPQQMVQSAPMAMTAVPIVSATPTPASSSENIASADDSKFVIVKSPMIGTFYRTPGPDKDPFVNVGSVIQKETNFALLKQ